MIISVHVTPREHMVASFTIFLLRKYEIEWKKGFASFCTGHFVMVPLNMTYLHCLQHSLFEHLFNLYYTTTEKFLLREHWRMDSRLILTLYFLFRFNMSCWRTIAERRQPCTRQLLHGVKRTKCHICSIQGSSGW